MRKNHGEMVHEMTVMTSLRSGLIVEERQKITDVFERTKWEENNNSCGEENKNPLIPPCSPPCPLLQYTRMVWPRTGCPRHNIP
jgi:hypothetical protein